MSLRRQSLGPLLALGCSIAAVANCTFASAQEIRARDVPPLASFDSAWAAVSRSYWDIALVEGRWKVVRDSLRAALGEAPNDDAVRRAIRALIAVPKQSHFVLIPSSAAPRTGRAARAQGTAGIEVRVVDGAVIAWRVDTAGVAHLAGLRAGDRITKIDTVAIEALRGTLRDASHGDTANADRLLAAFATARLSGGIDEEVEVEYVNARNERRPVILVRAAIDGTVTQFGNLPAFVVKASVQRMPLTAVDTRRVAVIRFNAWFPVVMPSLDSMFFQTRDAAGVVIDLRGNPGGVIGLLAGVSGHVLDTALSLGELKSRSGTIRFVANPRRVRPGGQTTAPFSGPVAILVDEFSASTSEFFSAGMQALGRAKVFGSRTAGQALPAAMGRLPSGDVLMHVIADHADSKGRRIEGVGVIPDTPTPLRVRDLRAGRDAALEAALAWIAAGAK